MQRIVEIGLYFTSQDQESIIRIEEKEVGFVGHIFSFPPLMKQPFSYSFQVSVPKNLVTQGKVLLKLYFYITYETSGFAEGSNYENTWGPNREHATNQDREIYITVLRDISIWEIMLKNQFFINSVIIGILVLCSITFWMVERKKKRVKQSNPPPSKH